MKIAYFDCSAGISGDMCLGALVDAGVPLKEMDKGLRALPVGGYTLEAKKVKRASIAATKVDVIVAKAGAGGRQSGARRWKDIEKTIRSSSLSDRMKQKGLDLFRRLFESEGKVHGERYDTTHLHELGAVDCIVDIFGTLIGLDYLGVERVFSSPVNLGSGSVRTSHGRLPVPAPAAAELLKGVPVYSSDIPFELTTPTGAVLISGLSEGFPHMPLMKPERVGYGAGQKELRGFPNALRIFVGEDTSLRNGEDLQKVTVVETNLDDMNPQLYEYVMEKLFAAGALDVWLDQVIMKKGRPGVVLAVLCRKEKRADIADTILEETTSIGLRFSEVSRVVLERQTQEIDTEFGKLRVKLSRKPHGIVKAVPEYEDCKKIAKEYGIPLGEVIDRLKGLASGTKKH
ncbi:MAG: nickel pincer cofactor biosynthesis protein LarC [Nitrospirae bacterium]|nr:nickel pincer cofactor biosynthesis protein LarC [Nitrospirota bacterium]